MKSPTISLIVAMDKKRGIGNDGRIPWNIPQDRIWFQKKTTGHVVIMGRKTFESIVEFIGCPLPDRKNIIISRKKRDYSTDVIVANNPDKALREARKRENNGEIFIIGGESIYKHFIGVADRLYLTTVSGKYEADTFFPEYSMFKKIKYSDNLKSEGINITFEILERE